MSPLDAIRKKPATALASAQKMEERPNLKSLVTSWSAIALIAIGAAAYTISAKENDLDITSYMDASKTAAIDTTIDSGTISTQALNMMRYLQETYTYDDHAALFPLTSNDYTGFVCAILGLMVAAGGGIGGGGILVPIYILVMGFPPKNAIPLSNITVFGGAVANTYLNSKKRHPLADRPMVDWDLILIMEPLTIAGALMGAFLNKLLREEVLVIMLVLLLSFTAYNTLKKAIKMYKIESIHIARQMAKESELTSMASQSDTRHHVEAEDELLQNVDDDVEKMKEIELEAETPEANELRMILEEERIAPMLNIKVLLIMFVVVLTINVLKGGGAFPSPFGIVCGGIGFWIANLIMLAWIVGISIWIRNYLIRRYERKEVCNYRYVEGDIKWDAQATKLYPAVCTLAGFFAGMFGVGGGIVKGPLMLAMGVHPKVSSASSACMILFTSFTATTSFVVFGLLIHDYALVCLFIGFTATYCGQIVLYFLMSKYERNSYIAFSIGGVVLLSALLMTVQSLVSMAEGGGNHPGGICGEG